METALRRVLRWPVLLGIAVVFVALSQVLPTKAPDETALAKLHCVALSVALDEHLFARQQAGETYPAEFLNDFKERQNRLWRYVASLQRSDHPDRLAYRPIMVQLQAARDTAVAQDPVAYLTSTWAEVQSCDDTLFEGQAA